MHITLWILQIILGLYFMTLGIMHFIIPPNLPQIMSWFYDLPPTLHYFSGSVEILGSLGLILPGLTKIQRGCINSSTAPSLTLAPNQFACAGIEALHSITFFSRSTFLSISQSSTKIKLVKPSKPAFTDEELKIRKVKK